MCTLTSLAPLLYFPSFVIHLPTKHVGVLKKLLWTCPCVPDRIGIWKCCFLRRGSDNQSIWKNLREKRTNNKLNPHMASTRGFQPGPRWWEASMALTTTPTLPHLISKVLNDIYLRFTRGTYFTPKVPSLVDLYVLLHLVGYWFLAPSLFTHHCLGSRTLHGLSTYICYCIMYIVRNSALHHIIWTLLPVYKNWYLHLKAVDQHSRSFVW